MVPGHLSVPGVRFRIRRPRLRPRRRYPRAHLASLCLATALLLSSTSCLAEEPPLTPRGASARVVRVAVIASDGQPAAGARVGLAHCQHRLLHVEGTCDPQGVAVLAVPGGVVSGCLWISWPQHRLTRVEWAGEDSVSVELSLASGIVQGWVMDPDRRPLAGARVVGRFSFPDAPPSFDQWIETVSDSRGHYRMEGGPADETAEDLILSAELDGWIPACIRRADTGHSLQLWGARRLRVSVRDESGRPLEATVAILVPLSSYAGMSFWESRCVDQWTRSGVRELRAASGVLEIDAVPSCPVIVEVRAPGSGVARAELTAARTDLEVVLEPGVTIDARVLGADGQPRAGVHVLCGSTSPDELENRLLELERDAEIGRSARRAYTGGTTASDGRVRISDLPARPSTIILFDRRVGATRVEWRPDQLHPVWTLDGAGTGTITGLAPPRHARSELQVFARGRHPIPGAAAWSSCSPWRVAVAPGVEFALEGVLEGEYDVFTWVHSDEEGENGPWLTRVIVSAGHTTVARLQSPGQRR